MSSFILSVVSFFCNLKKKHSKSYFRGENRKVVQKAQYFIFDQRHLFMSFSDTAANQG